MRPFSFIAAPGLGGPQQGRLLWKCDLASLPEAYGGEF
jgi:hypothetical protein